MNEKKKARMRRARSSRMKMRELGATRLSVHRTPRHIYAQVIAPEGAVVLVSDLEDEYYDIPALGSAVDAYRAAGLSLRVVALTIEVSAILTHVSAGFLPNRAYSSLSLDSPTAKSGSRRGSISMSASFSASPPRAMSIAATRPRRSSISSARCCSAGACRRSMIAPRWT